VVLTSAIGAVAYGHPDREQPFTEADWSDVDAGIPPYQKSKTLAERAAWDFIATEGNGLELAAVNPVGVLGPVLGADYSPSLGLIRRMLDGEVPASLKFACGYVDVRDVADLHLRAMTDPAAVGERFIAQSGSSLWVRDIAKILRDRLGERAMGRVNPQLRLIVPQLGKNFDATSEKARRVLGWRPRPIEQTVVETAESLLALLAAA
jgi:dihydroflavonol-4-reductase